MTKWKFRRKSSQNLPETYLYILKLCLMMPKNVGHFGFSTIVPSNIGICPIMPKTVGHNHRWAWGRQLGGGSAKFRPGGEWFLNPRGGEQVPPF